MPNYFKRDITIRNGEGPPSLFELPMKDSRSDSSASVLARPILHVMAQKPPNNYSLPTQTRVVSIKSLLCSDLRRIKKL
jgi:hypothetical protein